MVNTNGMGIAKDDRFLSGLAKLSPVIYSEFDSLRRETPDIIHGEDLIDGEMLASNRMQQAVMSAVLVSAIERGVNVD